MIRPQTCPVCGKELAIDASSSSSLFPFCSQRCRQVDLLRWNEGLYAIVEPLDARHLDHEFEGLDEDSGYGESSL